MAQLSREQQKVLAEALAEAQRLGVSARPRKALVEAGLTESGLRNLNYGDRDSLGFLQQRPSQGWGNARNVTLAARDFLTRAQALNDQGFKGSAGQLAQAVQRSAFPGRYDQQGAVAQSLLGGAGGGLGGGMSPGVTTATTSPGIDNSGLRAQLIEQWLNNQHDPNALAALASGLLGAKDQPGTSSTTTTPGKFSSKGGKGKGKLSELFYDPLGGWKNGQSIGAIGGHGDHVHVGLSSTQVLPQLEALAKQMGLTITSTTGGKHVAGSLHYAGRAFDAAGDPKKMAAFAERIRHMYGL